VFARRGAPMRGIFVYECDLARAGGQKEDALLFASDPADRRTPPTAGFGLDVYMPQRSPMDAPPDKPQQQKQPPAQLPAKHAYE